jgi:ABC-type sugar transport system ATPase subunit
MPKSAPSTESVALELIKVGKSFGPTNVLRDVSFTVTRGSIHGLCGENGAGKSTLVKILDGQYRSGTYDGEVLVGGEHSELSSSKDALSHGIAVVPQETSVLDNMTVAENITLGSLPAGRIVRSRILNSDVRQFLNSINMDLDPAQTVGDLRMSSKQLLMIARALYRRPSVLLLDEPTTALTDAEMGNLHLLIRELSAAGTTVIIVSHKLEEILELCDRVSVLRDGSLVDLIEKAELTQSRLVKSMTGRSIEELYPPHRSEVQERVVLDAEGIVVSHPTIRGRNIVDNVSLQLRAGEVLGIGGPLGSGRSELLMALCGGLPRQGTIRLAGSALSGSRPDIAVARGIGFVSEDRKSSGLLFNMRIDDNVTLSAVRRFLTGPFVSRARQRAATQSRISQFVIAGATPASWPGELSGGNQQKILLARAILPSPKVILLDEPTKGVDVGAKADIYQTIHELAESGVGVVIVSSELPELLGNCHRILMMQRGRIVSDHDSATTTREQLLEATMIGSWSADRIEEATS